MKKIILFMLLITSLYSDAKVYVGSSYGYFNEKFDDDLDAQSSNQQATIKVGYGIREAYAIELSFEYSQNESKIFSDGDKDKYSLNIEFVKAFDIDTFVNPFFKAGFGGGRLKIDRELQDTLNFGSFNLGLGMFIPINSHFDFELGYNYRYLSYEGIDTVVDKVSYRSNLNAAYAGFNVRF